ncbi:DUF6402 family protein [Acidovorax sp. GBBC 1281]|uniref:DUF6402 family protein n=1 Tax=Acidovorax sp. GBBC 1281 TaxID=2940492 RepID=UPI00234BECD2|nr:DUF6402 family protein [Acidovorax sp. GBBC 1281]WCM97525.1 DUF6402 family protein [Acidovorax sp. GBBC 1281]
MQQRLVKVDQESLRAQLQKKLPPKVRLFQLEDIPGVMRSRMGWPVAAGLMERWFNGAAFRMPAEMKESRSPHRLNQLSSVHLEESIVTMSWALRFARVQTAMATLQSGWATAKGIKELRQKIKDQSFGKTLKRWRFGDFNQSAKVLDATCQVNYLTFGKLSDPMDDFYGAMGEAQLKVAASGFVSTGSNGSGTVDIDELAFYLRDSYDFNDSNPLMSQPLGFWGATGVERHFQLRRDIPISDQWVHTDAADVAATKYEVQNNDFRRWSALQGRGGDFMVLSDVHRVRLAFPLRFDLQ